MGVITVRDTLLFALIFSALLVRLLLSPPIWHHGEAREGLGVQAIVQDHQWILPLRNGELPSKPPLYHWLAALAAILFGLSDFTVRLPSAIGAEIMAIATFLMGIAVGGRRTAWLAVGALLGMYEFWDSGTQARVDMVFSACVTVSIAGFFFWYRDGHKAGRATFYIASACAVLAKGPVGIALPGLVIVGFLAAEGRLRLLWKFWSWPLAGLVLFIDLGWYALAYQIAGNEFLGLQIERENVDRVLGTGDFSTQNTFLTMAGWLATRTLPWSIVLIFSLIRRVIGEREDSAGRFLHTWWIAIFAVFAIAAGKRAVYLLPLYPAIALLAARAIGAMIRNFTELSRSDSMQKAPIAKRIGVGFAIFDLALMLSNHNAWQDGRRRETRLAFVEKISTIVPTDARLFAAPDPRITELTVVAYRLGRKIELKPITAADHNEYYLAPIESKDLPGIETRALASSEIDKVALFTVAMGKSKLREHQERSSLIHNGKYQSAG